MGFGPKALIAKIGVDEKEKHGRFEKDHEIKSGPLKKRRCTDVACLIVFVLYWGVYLVVTFVSMENGSPAKLIKPRDFQGSYCGIRVQWNGGPDLESKEKLSFMMNVTSAADNAAKQLLCSSLARDDILSSDLNQSDKDHYLCECCFAPCPSCTGSHDVGRDLLTAADLGTVSARMADLRVVGSASVRSLFSPTGPNGDLFQGIWADASAYLHRVCLADCGAGHGEANGTGNATAATARTYQYEPAPDSPLRLAWETLARSGGAGVRAVMREDFRFRALPESACNYPSAYCVPFPGLEFEELQLDYCSLRMAAEVVDAVGAAAASVFVSLGMDSFTDGMVETLGKWVGDFERSIDTFAVVCVCAFALGLVFLVLLRFFVKFCVWFAIGTVLAMLCAGGGFAYIRSYQCEGAGIFETGEQTAGNVVNYAGNTLSNTLSGGGAPSEELRGLYDGNYTGLQHVTRGGRECRAWDDAVYNAANYPDSNLLQNGMPHSFCRNPFAPGDANVAPTIWCLTTDPQKRWELCDPITLIKPTCEHGYAVPGERSRQVLEYLAYATWGLAALWALVVICFRRRVQLAISLNRVAADFVATQPLVLLVPIVEIILACLWCLVWVMSAAFLLSQVPDSHTPTDYYGTFAEAEAACYANTPQGFIWKDAICDAGRCFRCAPPRFMLDHRFVLSFFAYLWNNLMLVAIAQCVIAATVGAWFFSPNAQKGRRSYLAGAIKTVLRYHPGSLALGAFLIAVVQLIRYIMYYIQSQQEVRRNKVCLVILRALTCCLWCFENLLKFLNKNAYIQIALMGTNFCTSAQRAFFLIVRNWIRFGMLAVLGKVIHLIGLSFIMSSTLVAGYFLIREMHADLSPVVPLIVYAFLSYLVAKLYMSVFALAVDTSLQCFLICEEMGVTEGDTFVPKYLRSCLKVQEGPGSHQGALLPLEADELGEPAEAEPGVPLGSEVRGPDMKL